jgi:aspartate kinase
MIKVCKFGGSSLSDAERIGKVCDIVVSDPERRIVVVSAPGKRDRSDRKITDMLIECAEKALNGESFAEAKSQIVERFAAIQKALGLPEDLVREIERDLDARLTADTGHKARFMDSLKAAGEDNCAKLVTRALNMKGLDAHYLNPKDAGLLLSDEYGNAQLLPESYDNLAALREARGVTVFPGFFGYTREGEVVTFPRGGSDITGSILAAAVKADVYENFTDVDTVCAIDPGLEPDVQPIPQLTYREMRELSYAGFGVLHDEAIIPAVRAGIPICIKNTLAPDLPGTLITPTRQDVTGQPVGIAYTEGFVSFLLSKYLMNREIGFGRKVLQIVEDEGIGFEHMPSGIDTLSIILREDDVDSATEKRMIQRFTDELNVSDCVVERGLALIMLAGEGMIHQVGTAATAARALAEAGVNIEMLDQGASEISIMFGVKGADAQKAVRSLYRAFFTRSAS